MEGSGSRPNSSEGSDYSSNSNSDAKSSGFVTPLSPLAMSNRSSIAVDRRASSLVKRRDTAYALAAARTITSAKNRTIPTPGTSSRPKTPHKLELDPHISKIVEQTESGAHNIPVSSWLGADTLMKELDKRLFKASMESLVDIAEPAKNEVEESVNPAAGPDPEGDLDSFLNQFRENNTTQEIGPPEGISHEPEKPASSVQDHAEQPIIEEKESANKQGQNPQPQNESAPQNTPSQETSGPCEVVNQSNEPIVATLRLPDPSPLPKIEIVLKDDDDKDHKIAVPAIFLNDEEENEEEAKDKVTQATPDDTLDQPVSKSMRKRSTLVNLNDTISLFRKNDTRDKFLENIQFMLGKENYLEDELAEKKFDIQLRKFEIEFARDEMNQNLLHCISLDRAIADGVEENALLLQYMSQSFEFHEDILFDIKHTLTVLESYRASLANLKERISGTSLAKNKSELSLAGSRSNSTAIRPSTRQYSVTAASSSRQISTVGSHAQPSSRFASTTVGRPSKVTPFHELAAPRTGPLSKVPIIPDFLSHAITTEPILEEMSQKFQTQLNAAIAGPAAQQKGLGVGSQNFHPSKQGSSSRVFNFTSNGSLLSVGLGSQQMSRSSISINASNSSLMNSQISVTSTDDPNKDGTERRHHHHHRHHRRHHRQQSVKGTPAGEADIAGSKWKRALSAMSNGGTLKVPASASRRGSFTLMARSTTSDSNSTLESNDPKVGGGRRGSFQNSSPSTSRRPTLKGTTKSIIMIRRPSFQDSSRRGSIQEGRNSLPPLDK